MDKLADIIDLQFKMIELSRKHGRKKEPQIAICLDDVSDNPRFSKNPLLTKLYSRGRHAHITTVCSVHRSRGILNPVVRSQVTGVLFFKQRNYLELQAFLEDHKSNIYAMSLIADLLSLEGSPEALGGAKGHYSLLCALDAIREKFWLRKISEIEAREF